MCGTVPLAPDPRPNVCRKVHWQCTSAFSPTESSCDLWPAVDGRLLAVNGSHQRKFVAPGAVMDARVILEDDNHRRPAAKARASYTTRK
eukprot:CAMPEP_0174351894 /NCGR_PEP_ID=MMETSP0811_2-20130205/9414_1 /TAXON_ID=73025 ORGANISM="Eutreptiella gymnastica-like, Strain CCMP1594" /NCGR_SAMPLE_ID=MMETSP0811_2 /ASSEMBLY_ACC=CAM_ASM_000667 /LENGTH=88 /DNA_ID=CAMNT_0015481579 /DNA_START=247 /DNA_END=510 /DNA_ORIENTATION=+